MKFTELKTHLKSGAFLPCYFIAGDDGGIRKLAQNLFVKTVTAYAELNVSYFDSSAEGEKIVATCEGLPFMDTHRVVFVRDYAGKTEAIEKYLDNPCKTTLLVFEAELPGKNFKKILPRAEVVDCKRQEAGFLTQYAAYIATQNGCKITKEATALLIDYCNRYLSRIEGEIIKLSVDADVIDEKLIREKVLPDLEVAVYALSDSLSKRDKKTTIAYLDKILLDGNPPAMVLGTLYGQYRRLFYVSVNKGSDTLGSELGVKEYALRFLTAQAAAYSPALLKKICDLFAQAEYDFKTGKITDKNALYSCVLQVLNT